MAKLYSIMICTLALASLAACNEKPKEPTEIVPASVAPQEQAPEPLRGADVCGAQDTYSTVKDIVFNEAIKGISGDPVALNDLRRSVSVTMQFPLVKGVNEELQRTDCSGRLVLGLPPGSDAAFGGERELKADLEYSVQPAADGNGQVITANGIGFVVQKLITADAIRVIRRMASDGGVQPVRTYNPSFSCGPHLTNTERMICQDETLSGKDRRMSAAFKNRLVYYSGAERQELLATQRGLLRDRANCADLSCLNNWYDTQLADLGQ